MPSRTGNAAAPSQADAAPEGSAARRRSSGTASSSTRKSASRSAAESEMPLQTLAEALSARSYKRREDDDDEGIPRSFHLLRGDVERAKATSDGVQHRAYGTDIEDDRPGSLSEFITEAIRAACTYYEDLLNGGQEFRRIRKLPRGPSREGAQRGADKRAANRAAAKGADSAPDGS